MAAIDARSVISRLAVARVDLRSMALAIAMVGIAEASAFGSSSADARPCAGPFLVTDATIGSEWLPAIEGVRVRLNRNVDLDRCAELRIGPAQGGSRIQVTTADGRTAIRYIASPDKLLVTVEALLELPLAAAVRSSPPEPQELPDDPDLEVKIRPAVSAAVAHLEVGVGAAGRLAGAPLYGGGGAASFAQLMLDRWLIGVTARWEAVDGTLALPSPSGFHMQTFGVGIGLGRRVVSGDVALDAVLGHEVIVESQEADGTTDDIRGSAGDVRMDLLLRVSAPRTGRTRFYAAADAEVSPSRLRRTRQLDPALPALPSWSSGLQVGVLWGAL